MPALLTILVAGGGLVGCQKPVTTLRTDGSAGRDASAPVNGSPTTVPGGPTATGSPGGPTAKKTTTAPTTATTAPKAPTSAAPAPPSIAVRTGQLDAQGQPIWSPNVDATGATDVSDQMKVFLAAVPNGSTIDLQAGGRYRMEKTFLIDNRQDLTLRGNGAVVVATTLGDLNRASVRITYSSNIVVQGLNVVGANPLAGAKDKIYQRERGGQHGFDVHSSTNISLIGVSVIDTYGDFVYLGGRDGGPHTDGVLIQASTFARSGRQGITMTGARNVMIETSSVTEAKRSTFDFEPGLDAGKSVDHVTIRNNQVIDSGLLFVAAAGHGPVNQITIQGNQLTRTTAAVVVEDLDGGMRRDWKVLGNTGDLQAGHPDGAIMRFSRVIGLVVQGNSQSLKPNRDLYGVLATNSCSVVVNGNSFPNSAGQVRSVGTC